MLAGNDWVWHRIGPVSNGKEIKTIKKKIKTQGDWNQIWKG